MGVPQNRWYVMENPNLKWMKIGGTPISGHLHLTLRMLFHSVEGAAPQISHLPCQKRPHNVGHRGILKTRITHTVSIHMLFRTDSIISLDWFSLNICRVFPRFDGKNLCFPLDVPEKANPLDLLHSSIYIYITYYNITHLLIPQFLMIQSPLVLVNS